MNLSSLSWSYVPEPGPVLVGNPGISILSVLTFYLFVRNVGSFRLPAVPPFSEVAYEDRPVKQCSIFDMGIFQARRCWKHFPLNLIVWHDTSNSQY